MLMGGSSNIKVFELYCSGNSLLHRLDPRIKVAGLAVLSLLTTVTHWKGLALSSFAVMLLAIFNRIPPKVFRSLIIVVLWMGLFYGFAAGWTWPEGSFFWQGYWSKEGLMLAWNMIWRLGLIFALTRLYTAVTMPLEQGLSIAYFFNPLIRIMPKAADFALLLTLTLRFIPLIIEEASMIWKARILKGRWPTAKLKQSWEIIELIVPLILLSMRRAEELAENLMLRGYTSGSYRTLIFHERVSGDYWGIGVIGLWGALLILLR